MDAKLDTIVFGGGCFWCTEAVFNMVEGVAGVVPGYSGGETINPTYDEVSSGQSGHAEAVKIEFDRRVVNVENLLTIFFGSHDPTTLNRQGADIGSQYRSVIFYTSDAQKTIAEKMIEEINESSDKGESVVTEVLPLKKFYEAENYHKDYFARNPGNPYCNVVINPKLLKVQKNYGNLLKKLNER